MLGGGLATFGLTAWVERQYINNKTNNGDLHVTLTK